MSVCVRRVWGEGVRRIKGQSQILLSRKFVCIVSMSALRSCST